MFFLTMFLMDGPAEVKKPTDKEVERTTPPPPPAYDNSMFTNDDGQLPTLELTRFPPRSPIHEHSRL